MSKILPTLITPKIASSLGLAIACLSTSIFYPLPRTNSARAECWTEPVDVAPSSEYETVIAERLVCDDEPSQESWDTEVPTDPCSEGPTRHCAEIVNQQFEVPYNWQNAVAQCEASQSCEVVDYSHGDESEPEDQSFSEPNKRNKEVAAISAGVEESDPAMAEQPDEESTWPEDDQLGGDPVELSSGALRISQRDLHFPAPVGSLEFTRRYSSQSNWRGSLGSNWRHNFEVRLIEVTEQNRPSWLPADYSSRSLILQNGAASTEVFVKVQGDSYYLSPTGSSNTIRKTSEGWILQTPDGTTQDFNDFGYLTKNYDRFGNGYDITYEQTPLYFFYQRYCSADHANLFLREDPRTCQALAYVFGDAPKRRHFTWGPVQNENSQLKTVYCDNSEQFGPQCERYSQTDWLTGEVVGEYWVCPLEFFDEWACASPGWDRRNGKLPQPQNSPTKAFKIQNDMLYHTPALPSEFAYNIYHQQLLNQNPEAHTNNPDLPFPFEGFFADLQHLEHFLDQGASGVKVTEDLYSSFASTMQRKYGIWHTPENTYGSLKLRPTRVRDNLGREITFHYYDSGDVTGPNSTASINSFGLLKEVRALGSTIRFTYSRPSDLPRRLNEMFLTRVTRGVDSSSLAAGIGQSYDPLGNPADDRVLEYTYNWPNYTRTPSYDHFDYGLWKQTLSQTPAKRRGASLDALNYISQIADNIVTIRKKGDDSTLNVQSEHRYQIDPSDPSSLDRIVKQRASGSIQPASASPAWETEFGEYSLSYTDTNPREILGATPPDLPASLLARYPLEPVPEVIRNELLLYVSAMETLENNGADISTLTPSVPYYSLVVDESSPRLTRSAVSCATLSAATSQSFSPLLPRDSLELGLGALLDRLKHDSLRICSWTYTRDRDNTERYLGFNYRGQILVDATYEIENSDFIIQEFLYDARGNLVAKRTPTVGEDPWDILDGETTYSWCSAANSSEYSWRLQSSLLRKTQTPAGGQVAHYDHDHGNSSTKARYVSYVTEPFFAQTASVIHGVVEETGQSSDLFERRYRFSKRCTPVQDNSLCKRFPRACLFDKKLIQQFQRLSTELNKQCTSRDSCARIDFSSISDTLSSAQSFGSAESRELELKIELFSKLLAIFVSSEKPDAFLARSSHLLRPYLPEAPTTDITTGVPNKRPPRIVALKESLGRINLILTNLASQTNFTDDEITTWKQMLKAATAAQNVSRARQTKAFNLLLKLLSSKIYSAPDLFARNLSGLLRHEILSLERLLKTKHLNIPACGQEINPNPCAVLRPTSATEIPLANAALERTRTFTWAPHGLPLKIEEQGGGTIVFDYHDSSYDDNFLAQLLGPDTSNATSMFLTPEAYCYGASCNSGAFGQGVSDKRGFLASIRQSKFDDSYGDFMPESTCEALAAPWKGLLAECPNGVQEGLSALGLPESIIGMVAPLEDLNRQEFTHYRWSRNGFIRYEDEFGSLKRFRRDIDGRIHEVAFGNLITTIWRTNEGNPARVVMKNASNSEEILGEVVRRFDNQGNTIWECVALTPHGCHDLPDTAQAHYPPEDSGTNPAYILSTYLYSPEGRLRKATLADGLDISYVYNSRGGLRLLTMSDLRNNLNRQIRLEHDLIGNISQITYGDSELSLTEHLSYDGLNRISSTTNTRGLNCTHSYTSQDQLSRTICGNKDADAVEYKIEMGYDDFSRVKLIVDNDLEIRQLNWGRWGRSLEVDSNFYGKRLAVFDLSGDLLWAGDRTKIQRLNVFDPQTRSRGTALISTEGTKPVARSAYYNLDSMLRPISADLHGFNGSQTGSMHFDWLRNARGQVSQVKSPGDTSVNIFSNLEGWPLTIRQASDLSTQNFRDTDYFYNRQGQVVHQRAQGQDYFYDFDAFGDIISSSLPAPQAIVHLWKRDVLGRVVERLSATGPKLRYNYDHRGDLDSIYSNQEILSEFDYDTLGRLISHTDFNQALKRRGIAKTSFRQTLEYDALSRLKSTKLFWGNELMANLQTQWSVNQGALLREDTLATEHFEEQFDHEMRLQLATWNNTANIKLNWTLAQTTSQRTNLVETNEGDDLVREQTFDPFGRLSGLRYKARFSPQACGQSSSCISTTYDSALYYNKSGQLALSSETLNYPAGTDSQEVSKTSFSAYTYNPSGSLAQNWQLTPSAWQQAIEEASHQPSPDCLASGCSLEDYQYSQEHNLSKVSREPDGDTIWAQLSSSASGYQTPSIKDNGETLEVTHDPAGHIERIGKLQIFWDELDRLTSVKRDEQKVESYAYTATGELAARFSDKSLEEVYLFRGSKLLASIAPSGQPKLLNWWLPHGHQPLLYKNFSDNSVLYPMLDRRESQGLLWQTPGEIVQAVNRSPYGSTEVLDTQTLASCESANSTNCPDDMSILGFQAEPFYHYSGLSLFGTRWYSSRLKQFLSRDLMGVIDGPNTYQYVKGDPINLFDPSGFEAYEWTEEDLAGLSPLQLTGYKLGIPDYELKYNYAFDQEWERQWNMLELSVEYMKEHPYKTVLGMLNPLKKITALYHSTGDILDLLKLNAENVDQKVMTDPFAAGQNGAQALGKTVKIGINLLGRKSKLKGPKKGFDLKTPKATTAEMAEAVRQLETGMMNSIGRAGRNGPALPKGHILTEFQKRGLEENIRNVINRTIPAVKSGQNSTAALRNQMQNVRFRYIDQVPEAKAALESALKGTGVKVPQVIDFYPE